MRKIVLGLALVVVLGVIAAPATAHETCASNANKPQRLTGTNTVHFSGSIDCRPTNHDSLFVTVYAMRRNGASTGPFEIVDSRTEFAPSPRAVWAVAINLSIFNCNKDYRTKVDTGASPGGHGVSGKVSNILQNTC